jgi:hypothetical protein
MKKLTKVSQIIDTCPIMGHLRFAAFLLEIRATPTGNSSQTIAGAAPQAHHQAKYGYDDSTYDHPHRIICRVSRKCA